ncbi:MAG TPA: septation protein A [Rhizobacter sp.]|nr:septation protein A [Rhizobacter sp.]
MKFLLDFLPLLLFFGTFKFADAHKEWAAALASNHLGFLVSGGVVGVEEAPVLLATLIVIAATLIQVITLKLMRRKIDLMLWITLALVVVLGGATVWFHDKTFIKWKPSIAFWAMGIALWSSQVLFKKNLLQSMIGGELKLPDMVWRRLNFAWVAFFGVMGLINVYVIHNFSDSAWATFKVFGVYGLMIAFTVAQVLYLSRYMKDEHEQAAPDKLG